MENNGERNLAAAVIELAIVDFIKSEGKDVEALRFLLGQTEISTYWFQQAELDHLTPKDFTPNMSKRFVERFRRCRL